jgi:holo-[acyl-carrier protein] synthase
MIIGSGIDLCEVARMKSAVERHGARFMARVFTPREIAYCESKANRFERFAARFAAKEAGMKALGTGWRRGVGWQDFEVARMPGGRPALELHGRAAEIAKEMGVSNIALSLTHTAEQGMAMVIFERI